MEEQKLLFITKEKETNTFVHILGWKLVVALSRKQTNEHLSPCDIAVSLLFESDREQQKPSTFCLF